MPLFAAVGRGLEPARVVRSALRAIVGLVFCAFSISLGAAEVRILYSASLNGNLDGCTCRVQPVSGLVKRGAFIEAYRKEHPGVVLVDTGDLIANARNQKLSRSIFEAYRLLRYDAVLPGDQDLSLGPQGIGGAGLPFVAGNLWVRRSFPRSDGRLGPAFLSLNRSGARITIAGIVHPDALRFSGSSVRESFRLAEPRQSLTGLPGADLLIVLSHSGRAADRKLAAELGRPALFFGGHDQVLLEKPIPLAGGITYFQPGRDGDRLGEVVVRTLGGGKYQIVSHRLHRFDHATSPDHPAIRRLIQNLGSH